MVAPLENLSDEELDARISTLQATQKPATATPQEDLSGLSDKELSARIAAVTPSYLGDTAKAALAGIETGTAKAVLAAPTAADMALAGTSALAKSFIGPENPVSQESDLLRSGVHPYSYQGMLPGIQQRFPSSTYQAKYLPGKIAQGAADMLPSVVGGGVTMGERMGPALLKGTTSAIGGGVGGAVGGPPGEMVGALLGYGLPRGARFAVTPNPADPLRTEQAANLRGAGLDSLDAAQATGSPRLRSWLGSAPAGQGQEIHDVMMDSTGVPILKDNSIRLADRVATAKGQLSAEGQALASRRPLRVDNDLWDDLQRQRDYYQSSGGAGAGTAQDPVLDQYDRFKKLANARQLTGDQFWRLRQEWTGSPIPEVRRMGHALDQAMGRTLAGTPDEGAWNSWNNRYADVSGIEKSLKPGQETVAPATVAGNIERNTKTKQVASDAARLLQPIEPAGPSIASRAASTALGGLVGYMAAHSGLVPGFGEGVEGIAGLLLGERLGPMLASGAARAGRGLARNAQGYLGNQAWTPGPYTSGVDPKLATALLLGQVPARTQPMISAPTNPVQ